MKRDRALFRAALLLLSLCILLPVSGCGPRSASDGGVPDVGGLVYESTVPLSFTTQFSIYRYEGGYSFIDIVDSDRILVVPEGAAVPRGLDEDIVVVRQPLSTVYLAATSAMALFDALDALDSIAFVGSRTWYTDRAIQAMEDGSFVFAGKYNAPDYELLLEGGCQLAIESTMILHNPEVREKLQELGIRTIVERSSYEEHPLGRTEWIRVYGALLGLEQQADAIFASEAGKISALESLDGTGRTVAFFLINSRGNVVTYKSSGYVAEMLRIAGGTYIFPDLGAEDESRLSTVNMNMEEFYNAARDADVIIYNSSSFGSALSSLDEFLALSPVLEDFRAVQTGDVWSTTDSMFQQTDRMGSIIQEMNAILSGTAGDRAMTYFFKLT